MKAIELEKAYDPRGFEDRIYASWRDSGSFKPRDAGPGRAAFTIVIPPPNVTGVLHLGHGLNNSLQDIIIRFHRMRGERTLWVPGTDHAGIATQNVVEKKLRERGANRRDLGREQFVEETWKVAREHHEIISRQLARIGASVDWSRERFTLDEGLSRAVREVFVSLYERDLLYKGNYLVNWCCSCGTALSDDEVDHEDTPGKMYHLRYPVAGENGGAGYIELATTRPETMLGDTAVAVHPEDERYRALTGKRVLLPLTDREIPVVADAYVDREFGTGVVKITPAHDPNDWEVAKRHNLPVINILTPEGKLNREVPEKYRGLSITEAREKVLEDLKAGGWYIREEEISHAVGHCYRCHTVIEPFLSEQWFVRMKPLAEKALASWRRGEVVFYPRKWENTYQRWLENIRDWCVSRQLWWGHRIPAWTCKDCGALAVSRTDLSACPACGSARVEQDPDVLDTWFSSWLWPFTTLGWENGSRETPDYAAFYPTQALVTAYDIIFFWVARMIMAGLEFTGKAPFRDIYIHGLIRDKRGRKMSKSLGNGLDPLELVDEFGADALKFTLAFMCAQGQDLLVDKDSFRLGSKFANKVWNASRYILMNLEGRTLVNDPAPLPADRWIYSRLNSAARDMTAAFTGYRFNDAAITAYEYFWNDFCDWYVEASKLSMKGNSPAAEKDRAVTVLLDVLTQSLALLHPLIPFVTEEIYGKLPAECKQGGGAGSPAGGGAAAELLINAAYPEYDEKRADPQGEAFFAFLQDLVRRIRTCRAECTVTPDRKLRAAVKINDAGKIAFLEKNAELVKLLAGLGRLDVASPPPQGADPAPRSPDPPASPASGGGAVTLAGPGYEALLYIGEAVDLKALKAKFEKNLDRDKKFIAGLEAKIANPDFTGNAPPELVEGERQKLSEARERTGKIESYLKGFA
ncbi:MAG: valine--tRNA ligase [Treponema sp.]|jgi:valyl-tRNA synthetase|nr:valine--tRNA ligase [Treponema sp.]